MSEEATATKEFDAAISKMGDEIAGLTLSQAVELADYMKETYNIEPAAGGAVSSGGQINAAALQGRCFAAFCRVRY